MTDQCDCFFFQAEDGIRDIGVTGVQTCALPILQTSADDNQIITGISGTEGALGYVGYAFADENKDKLKILQVDGGDGCVEPTIETIAGGQYTPLSRPLFMYPSTKSIKEPAVKAYLDFVNRN